MLSLSESCYLIGLDDSLTATIVTGVPRIVYNGMYIHAGEKVSLVFLNFMLSSGAHCVFVTVCGCHIDFFSKAGPTVTKGYMVFPLPRISLFT